MIEKKIFFYRSDWIPGGQSSSKNVAHRLKPNPYSKERGCSALEIFWDHIFMPTSLTYNDKIRPSNTWGTHVPEGTDTLHPKRAGVPACHTFGNPYLCHGGSGEGCPRALIVRVRTGAVKCHLQYYETSPSITH